MLDPTAVIVTLLLVGVPAGLMFVAFLLRHRQRERVIALVREGIELGRPLPPELAAALSPPRDASPEIDYRRGVMLIGAGAALVVVGLVSFVAIIATQGSGAIALGASISALGAIPACLGGALIVLSRRGTL